MCSLAVPENGHPKAVPTILIKVKGRNFQCFLSLYKVSRISVFPPEGFFMVYFLKDIGLEFPVALSSVPLSYPLTVSSILILLPFCCCCLFISL